MQVRHSGEVVLLVVVPLRQPVQDLSDQLRERAQLRIDRVEPCRVLAAPGGRILGAIDDMVLGDTAFTLNPRDAPLLYTDGVTEARTGRGSELFGDRRLAATRAGCHDLTAEAILDQILAAVTDYNHGDRPDDTAIMGVRVG